MEKPKSDIKKHSGKSIQAWAADVKMVIIVITVIYAIILCFAFGWVGIVLGLVTLGGGLFLAWLMECVLHGFGEIVENTAETASYLKMLTAQLSQEPNAIPDQEPKPAPEKTTEEPPAPQAQPPVKFPFARSSVEEVTCPNCGKTQFSSRNKCYHCGTEFQFTDGD